MIVNPDKFQAIVIKKNCRMKDSYALNINNQTINSENCVKLLGVGIDNTLSFKKHISTLYKKASNQLNAIRRIQKYMSFKEKEVFLNSFVLSNFYYCPLLWHFCSWKSLKKIKKIQERVLRILHDDSTSDYNQLNKPSKTNMEVKRLRNLRWKYLKLWIIWTPNTWKKFFIKLQILHIDPLI